MTVCPKCGKKNNDTDKFCFYCGSPAGVKQEKPSAPQDDVKRDPNGYPIYDKDADTTRTGNNTAKQIAVGSKQAIEKDLKGLRPVTRAAYYVVQSDNTTWIRTGLAALFGLACFAIVAIIKGIYDILCDIVTTSSINFTIETGLTDIYNAQTPELGKKLLLYIVLLFVMVFFYIVLGRLILRIKKVKRKRKKVEQKDMV